MFNNVYTSFVEFALMDFLNPDLNASTFIMAALYFVFYVVFSPMDFFHLYLFIYLLTFIFGIAIKTSLHLIWILRIYFSTWLIRIEKNAISNL